MSRGSLYLWWTMNGARLSRSRRLFLLDTLTWCRRRGAASPNWLTCEIRRDTFGRETRFCHSQNTGIRSPQQPCSQFPAFPKICQYTDDGGLCSCYIANRGSRGIIDKSSSSKFLLLIDSLQ